MGEQFWIQPIVNCTVVKIGNILSVFFGSASVIVRSSRFVEFVGVRWSFVGRCCRGVCVESSVVDEKSSRIVVEGSGRRGPRQR